MNFYILFCLILVIIFDECPLYRNKQNELIATAGGDNSIYIFKEKSSPSGEPQAASFDVAFHKENAHLQDVNSVQWNPKHMNVLASCGDDGTIKIWRLNEI